MSSTNYSTNNFPRHQDSVTIMHPIKKKAIASYHSSVASVSDNEQPLDFSTKKTATPCQESELRQFPDVPSPAAADHPTQVARHNSPEESVLNIMQFRRSPVSSSSSLPSSPLSSQLQPSPPPPSEPAITQNSSPNGIGMNGMSGRLEEISLSSVKYPSPSFYSMPPFITSSQYLTVDTTQGLNGVNHGSPVAVDSKLMQCQRFYPFVHTNGNASPEYLNRFNSDPSVTPLLIATDKKVGKTARPFNAFPNGPLPVISPTYPDILPYPITSSIKDQELRYAQYADQFLPLRRRVTNGQVKNGESKATTADKISKAEDLNLTDSNSSDSSPAANGNGQAAVTSTGPSTSEQALKRKNRSLPDELKDEAYWERRRKNNEAAKRSRDARRAKEDEIAMRCSFLQNENLKLRAENETLKLHLRNLTAHISR